MDPTKAKDIKKRRKEYTEELYKQDFNDPENHDGVITYLEPNYLKWEVKRSLGPSLWANLVEVMEFQLSYFKSLKMMLLKCTLNMPANLENSAVATGVEKVNFHPTPKKGNTKKYSNCCTIILILHASKVMLNIL